MDRTLLKVDDAAVDQIVERACAWAEARVGSTDYALRCLAFVEDAYEQANGIEIFGGAFARESADLYGAKEAVGAAPRGAFVFFSTSGPVDGVVRDWGHVGLAIGDGRMVHAWPAVRVDDLEAASTLPSGDWSALTYLGWAPPSRILRGTRDGAPEPDQRSNRGAGGGLSSPAASRVRVRSLARPTRRLRA